MEKSENFRKISNHYRFRLRVTVFSIVFSPFVIASELDVRGFLTAGGGVLSSEKIGHVGYDESLTFGADSVLGLQATANISEDFRVTSQLLASGQDDSNVRVDWAYLSHDILDNFTLRMGRLRSPLYLYSESLDVGYAYPWIRPPVEVYNIIPFSSFDGVQGYVKNPWGDWEMSLLAYAGSVSEDTSLFGQSTNVALADYAGLGLVWDRDWLSIRVGYHQAKTTISSSEISTFLNSVLEPNFPTIAADLRVDDKKTRFYQIGVQINKGKFLLIAESTRMALERSFVPIHRSWYGLLGYQRSRQFLFHLTYAEVIAELHLGFSDPIPAGDALKSYVDSLLLVADDKQRSVLVGMRYDYTVGIAYKLEWQRILVDKGRSSVGGKSDISVDGHTDAISFAVDVIF